MTLFEPYNLIQPCDDNIFEVTSCLYKSFEDNPLITSDIPR